MNRYMPFVMAVMVAVGNISFASAKHGTANHAKRMLVCRIMSVEDKLEVGAAGTLGILVAWFAPKFPAEVGIIAWLLYLAFIYAFGVYKCRRKWGNRMSLLTVLLIGWVFISVMSLIVWCGFPPNTDPAAAGNSSWSNAEKLISQSPLEDEHLEGFVKIPPTEHITVTPGGAMVLPDAYKISTDKVDGRAAVTIELATGEKRTFPVPASGFHPYVISMQIGDKMHRVAVDSVAMDIAKIRTFQRKTSAPQFYTPAFKAVHAEVPEITAGKEIVAKVRVLNISNANVLVQGSGLVLSLRSADDPMDEAVASFQSTRNESGVPTEIPPSRNVDIGVTIKEPPLDQEHIGALDRDLLALYLFAGVLYRSPSGEDRQFWCSFKYDPHKKDYEPLPDYQGDTPLQKK